MKHNHFIYSYQGNKRNEAEHFIEKTSFDDIENIIEPFCGSSAISFQIWLKYGDKFNYFLNDKNKRLIEVYETLKTKSIEEIEEQINEISRKIENKNDWNLYLKNKDNETVFKYIFFCKFSTLSRYGFYPLRDERFKHEFKINDLQKQFIKFIKSPQVVISNDDWFVLFDKLKNDKNSMFIFDPPYINSCNDFYIEKTLNVYQYFFDNKIETFQSKIYLILEDIWLIRMLFANNKILFQYDKRYLVSKKQTKHIIISYETSV